LSLDLRVVIPQDRTSLMRTLIYLSDLHFGSVDPMIVTAVW
jgi:hypothetical protein